MPRCLLSHPLFYTKVFVAYAAGILSAVLANHIPAILYCANHCSAGEDVLCDMCCLWAWGSQAFFECPACAIPRFLAVMEFSYSLIPSLILCSLVAAHPDLPDNSTSPWTIVEPGWVPEPSIRGTMGIIWTCLVTIFACSWTVTHPDFQGYGRFGSDSKIKMCVIAVLAPEVITTWAFGGCIHVKRYTEEIRNMNRGPWDSSQTFFVNMGGIKLEFADGTRTLGEDERNVFDDNALDDLRRALLSNIFTTDSISATHVKARARTNHILKAMVCFQSSWLVVQVIGRALARLPTTSLEVVTLGYVSCALITYASWWYKPQDVEVPIRIDCRSMTKKEFRRQIAEVHIHERPNISPWKMLMLALLPTTFGAIHCIAWNFYFATRAEGIIWKVASVLITVLPVFIPFFLGYSNGHLMESTWGLVVVIPYSLIRLYLMIEPFVAFRKVPQGVFYTVDWAEWIPHI